MDKSTRMDFMGKSSATAAVLLLPAVWVALAACGISKVPMHHASGPWYLAERRVLAAHELWKEHNGAAGLYLDRGCVSETLSDYRHAHRPWTLRCSVFDLTTSGGARSLFEYYRNGIGNEQSDIAPIGDAAYLWKSAEASAWILGFCYGKYFVEVSLTETDENSKGPSDAARAALLAFACNLAQSLGAGPHGKKK
ncbi:MAG: hypothetical protein N3D11_09475 [Candidatus Sumerlaeia bacterium]|nr:hypothetical protein [Candidatus Sumerlaeia bacterium]